MKALTEIASAAARNDIPFLLTGGHAVITHGFPRSTFDLDLIVCQNNREDWLKLTKEMGYELHREGPTFIQFNGPGQDSFPLDLMLVNAETFEKLRKDAVLGPSNLEGVLVISLLHLLALKCHAIKHGHAGRIVKDADDVLRLVQHNGIDMSEPSIRELFLKHGTHEFYEKVRKICGQD